MGRTGRLFAHEHFGVTPDIMTLAKGLANGLPAGAILVRQEVADLFAPGTHATTFGAGPVIMAAAGVVLRTLTAQGFMEKVRETGEYFREKLQGLVQTLPDKVEGVRGLGLMQGVVLKAPCARFGGRAFAERFCGQLHPGAGAEVCAAFDRAERGHRRPGLRAGRGHCGLAAEIGLKRSGDLCI